MTNRFLAASNQRPVQNTTLSLSSAATNLAVDGPAQQQAAQGDAPSTTTGPGPQPPAQSHAATRVTPTRRPLPQRFTANWPNIPPDVLEKISRHGPPERDGNILSNVPPSVWDEIASLGLSDAEMRGVSTLGGGTELALRPRLESNRCADQARRFNSHAEMHDVLQDINELRADLRSEPLRLVMLRLYALPLSDRAAGLVSFRAALADPALAIEHRPSVPPELYRILYYRDARAAVRAGERVDTTASIFNVTARDDIRRLETISKNSRDPGTAGAAMRAGGNAQTVAQQCGFITPEGVSDLEEPMIDELPEGLPPMLLALLRPNHRENR